MADKELLAFVIGLGIGAAVTWLGVKNYYKTIADEEIEECKAFYKKSQKNIDISVKNDTEKESYINKEETPSNTATTAYENALAHSYDLAAKEYPKEDNTTDIYTISREEWEDSNGYNKIGATYYAGDQRLVADEIMEDEEEFLDPWETVGFDNLDKFGEYEPNYIYVRNERTKTDFEVLKNDCAYYGTVVED